MERHPFARPLISLFVLAALVLASSACGGITDADALLEDVDQIETITEEPGDGEAPATLPADEEGGETSYDQPPTVDGEPVTDEDIKDVLEDAGPGTVLEGDFSGFEFDDMDLSGFVLNGGKFDGASFVRTKLNGAEMRYGSFVGADFTSARLQGADMSYGNFTQAIFLGAEMPGESFKTTGAIFDSATWTHGQTCAAASIGTCDY